MRRREVFGLRADGDVHEMVKDCRRCLRVKEAKKRTGTDSLLVNLSTGSAT